MVKFTEEEKNYIADFYLKHREILDSTGRSEDSNKKRKKLYETLVNAIKQINPDNPKSLKQIKEKLQYLKSQAKQKYAKKKKSRRRTGGGKDDSQNLTQIDEKMIGALGKSAGFGGIPGGIESGGPKKAYGAEQELLSEKSSSERSSSEESSEDGIRTPPAARPIHDSPAGTDFSSPLLSAGVTLSPSIQISPAFYLGQPGHGASASATIPKQMSSAMQSQKSKPKLRQSLAAKKFQYLESSIEARQLTKEVLEAQLKAAQSTVAVNTRLEELLDKASGLLDTIQAFYQINNNPVVLYTQPVGAEGSTSAASAPVE